jgi:hypothetical protein
MHFPYRRIAAFLFLAGLTLPLSAGAEEEYQPGSYSRLLGMSAGMEMDLNINHIRGALNLTSPWLFDNSLAFRISDGFDAFQAHYSDSTNSNAVWATFSSVRVGAVISPNFHLDWIRPYGEFGIVAVFGNNNFSSTPLGFGVYQNFGIDVMFSPGDFYSLFCEVGAVGMLTGGYADRVSSVVSLPGNTVQITGTNINNTNVCNGFSINFGVRFYPF